MTNDNLRGLPVVSPWDVLDAATRGEEWVTFGELKRAREQLATDYAAIVAERDALRVDARRLDWLDSQRGDDVQCDRNGDPELVAHYWSVYDQCYDVRTAIDAAIAAQQAEGEDRG